MTVDVEKIKAGTDRKSNECSCRDALNNEWHQRKKMPDTTFIFYSHTFWCLRCALLSCVSRHEFQKEMGSNSILQVLSQKFNPREPSEMNREIFLTVFTQRRPFVWTCLCQLLLRTNTRSDFSLSLSIKEHVWWTRDVMLIQDKSTRIMLDVFA